jgi:hypothetical protein
MIFELLITPLFALANFLMSLFPTVAMPSAMAGYLNQAFGLVRGLSIFVPVDTFFTVLGVVFTVYGIEFLVSFSSWLFRKIPTLS